MLWKCVHTHPIILFLKQQQQAGRQQPGNQHPAASNNLDRGEKKKQICFTHTKMVVVVVERHSNCFFGGFKRQPLSQAKRKGGIRRGEEDTHTRQRTHAARVFCARVKSERRSTANNRRRSAFRVPYFGKRKHARFTTPAPCPT
jgi:hypothetical protein